MKKIISVLLLLVTLTLLLASCSQKATVTRGETTDTQYTNSAVGVTFNKPDGWKFYTDDELAKLLNITADLYKDEDLVNSAKVTGVIDFMAMDPVSGNNVNMTIENLVPSGSTGISMEEYIEITKKNLNSQMADMKYTFEDPTTIKLGTVEFTKLTASCSYSGVSMTQFIYLKKIGNCMVSYTATSVNGAAASTFEAMFS